ncbi:MAG: deoxyguanosinetriphosphate triphosphohydrolase [Oscillospiraceae bacterium]|nr:deoxyguanosinetriphosphate triphosphohydrolase [Oscillospiraceae bacterium]
MPDFREERERLEATLVSDRGVRAAESRGREKWEEEDGLRTCFQRDADRITHCKSFRRLKHKTQVFLQPEGDHYRTRLTHTLEVTRLSRTVGRALRLNEDLCEAIALGHDLGHTPFGHAGERALRNIYKEGFHHYEQSLRVVDAIEKDGQGLNLCYETRMGILAHTHGLPDESREAVVVRLCDHIAYLNHDLDDAERAGLLKPEDVPPLIVERCGERNSRRINAFVEDVVEQGMHGEIGLSREMKEVWDLFHEFMYERVYYNPVAKGEEAKVEGILRGIWEHYVAHPDRLPPEYRLIAERDGLERAVTDYVSGMSDDYAIYQYGELFIPAAWSVR